ncbi:GGDEF domain-containing protein [Gammaproteobacteria bacterium AS21]
MINQLQEKYQLSLLLLLGVVAVLGISPFVVIRYYESNFSAVIIDVALIVGIVILIAFAFCSKKIRAVSIIIAVFTNTGVAYTVIANGIDGLFWVYPVFASTFILVKPVEALSINLIAAIFIIAFADVFHIISLDSYIVTILMLSISTFVYTSHSLKQYQLLKTLNTVDTLTGALNRRAMNADLNTALAKSERDGIKQLLVILDLDHFKKVNDKYGHAVGDDILKKFVAIITTNIREYDRLYRFGGEEFVLLISDAKDQQQAIIDKLRKVVKNELNTPDGAAITVSLGVASWLPGTTIDTWLKRADDALYQAKENGRDCAVFSET